MSTARLRMASEVLLRPKLRATAQTASVSDFDTVPCLYCAQGLLPSCWFAQVKRAAYEKDNIYLRAAQSTGVLDFPSLEPALANLRCDSSGAGGTRVEACVTKVNVAAWQDASRKLKVDIAKAQGSEVLLQDLQVAQQALDALTAELNHQP
mmetsp:Transcript_5577/g.14165  ORF Transcript_5577/g.14165 Transcript_5577/m.14165 type:complete len:151 (-) Transcript_5577:1418-1870(-)